MRRIIILIICLFLGFNTFIYSSTNNISNLRGLCSLLFIALDSKSWTKKAESSDPVLRSMQIDDIDRIVSLESLMKFDNVKSSDRTKMGFLISGFSREKYVWMLSNYNKLYVAIEDGQIVAFLVAYSSDRIQPDEKLNIHIINEVDRPFILIKQIATHPDYRRQGIARMLYERLIDDSSDYTEFYTAIVDDPPNETSIKFHKEIGFEHWGNYTPEDGKERSIWYFTRIM